MVYYCSDNTTTFDQIQAFSAKYFHFIAKLFPFLSKKNIARLPVQPHQKERVLLHDATALRAFSKEEHCPSSSSAAPKGKVLLYDTAAPALLAKKNIARFQAQPHQKERGPLHDAAAPCISGPLGCSLNALVLQDAIHKPFRPGNIPGVHVFHNQWNVGMMFCQKRYIQVVI